MGARQQLSVGPTYVRARRREWTCARFALGARQCVSVGAGLVRQRCAKWSFAHFKMVARQWLSVGWTNVQVGHRLRT